MPTVNTQVYTILNSAVAAAMGRDAATITAGNFVDFGRSTMAAQSSATSDAIFGALIDRIAKTAVMNRLYRSKWRNVLRTELEYGAVLQRIRVAPMTALEGEQWIINEQLTAGDVSPFMIHLPDVQQTLFSDHKAYEFGITITRDQMKTAFTSEGALTAFIEGIYTSIASTVELYIERAARLAVNTFIAEKYNLRTATGKIHAVNLIEQYYLETGETVNEGTCLVDPDFLKWTAVYISRIRSEMAELSTSFAKGTIPVYEDDPKMIALTQLTAALNTYVNANAYNVDRIPALNPDLEVTGWQANGNIRIRQNYTDSSGATVTVTFKPLAVLYSDRALGATVFDHTTDSIVNPRRKYTNVWEHITCGYYCDLDEAGVVFYIANYTPTT